MFNIWNDIKRPFSGKAGIGLRSTYEYFNNILAAWCKKSSINLQVSCLKDNLFIKTMQKFKLGCVTVFYKIILKYWQHQTKYKFRYDLKQMKTVSNLSI